MTFCSPPPPSRLCSWVPIKKNTNHSNLHFIMLQIITLFCWNPPSPFITPHHLILFQSWTKTIGYCQPGYQIPTKAITPPPWPSQRHDSYHICTMVIYHSITPPMYNCIWMSQPNLEVRSPKSNDGIATTLAEHWEEKIVNFQFLFALVFISYSGPSSAFLNQNV